jgi:magnesium chelatase family protein
LEECIEITKIHSIAGTLDGEILMRERPFRAPHHTITEKALIGGGKSARPGEITLAHRGVLFLDEFAEYRKETMDALRQPLENRKITISRVYGTYEFPADMMLAAAANPCKCGYYPDRTRCKCSESEVARYMARLSGPIMDRMDLCVGVPAVRVEELQNDRKAESSERIRKRVEAAAWIQRERYKNTGIHFNSSLNAADIKKYCHIGENEKHLLRHAFEHFSMSARGYYKIIKVARTIADLEGSVNIREEHLSQALGYRMT